MCRPPSLRPPFPLPRPRLQRRLLLACLGYIREDDTHTLLPTGLTPHSLHVHEHGQVQGADTKNGRACEREQGER